MAETDLNAATTSSMNSGGVPDYSVNSMSIDDSTGNKEFYWYNSNFPQYLGYYKQIPELKQAIDALGMWTAGKGWTVKDSITKVVLEHITGWGEDSFDSIIQNMIITKKFNGDSYAEIIREDGDNGLLINLKPLNPQNVRHVCDAKGIIIRYDVWDGSKWKEMSKDRIFHLCNNRVANEIHGVSVIESCKWIIDARNEAMADWRRVLHRSTVRVLEIDTDDTTTLTTIKTQYRDAIKNGEILILPKQREGGFQDLTPPPITNFIEWIRYLENFFYQAVGVPKIILGGSQEYSEASSKVGYLTFEVPYMTEQRLLEQDIWNQLGIKIEFDRPVSLKEEMQSSEAANTGQVGFQPNELNAQVGRNE